MVSNWCTNILSYSNGVTSSRGDTLLQGKPKSSGLTKRDYLLVIIFSSILYLNGLHGDFAYDDSRAITSNQDLLSNTPWYQVFKNDFWGTPIRSSNSHGSYRPIAVMSFRLNFLLHGLTPFGFHLFNLLLHLTVICLYMRFISFVLNSHRRITLISALLFASHPIHVESVTSIVGRADLGAATFYLLALLSYAKFVNDELHHHQHGGRTYLYASLAFATLSMLTKEHGVTCLAVCAVYHLFVVHRFFPFSIENYRILLNEPNLVRLRKGLTHLIVTAILLILVRFLIMASPPSFSSADNPASANSSVIIRFFTFLYLPAFNFKLLLYPRWLSFDWSMESIPLVVSLFDHRNLHSFIFYTALFSLLRKMARLYLVSQFANPPTNTTATCLETESQCPRCPTQNSSQNGLKARSSWDDNNNNVSNVNYNHLNGDSLSCSNGLEPYFDANNNDASVPNQNHPSLSLPKSMPSKSSPRTSRTLNRTDCLALSMALMIIPFLPASNLFFYVGFVVAERILYIPSLGYCLFLAICIESAMKLCTKSPILKIFIYSCICLLIMAFSVRTILRNVDWLTEENLYRSGIEVNPPKAYGNLANSLNAQGRIKEAEEAYKKALKYRANMADVHYNLGILLQEQGRYQEAVESYHKAIQFRPRLAVAYLNLALILARLGEKERAKMTYRHCAELDSTGLKDVRLHESTRIWALYNLGRLFADEENFDKALEIFEEAVSRMPPYYPAQSLYNVLGEMYSKLNQSKEAELWFRKSLLSKRDHVPVHLTYAKLLAKLNRTSEAEQLYRKAMQINPNDSIIYQHYGQLLLNSGRLESAVEIYKKGLEVAPNNYDIVLGIANTLRELRKNTEAEDYYKMAVTIRPNDMLSYSNLGAIYHLNGKYQLAMDSYMQALKLKPDDAITHTNLARLKQTMAARSI